MRKLLFPFCLLLLLLMLYSGLFLNKFVRYLHYDNLDPFGGREQYFFHDFYVKYGRLPESSTELKNLIRDNPRDYEGNTMAQYLVTYNDYNLHYNSDSSLLYVYLFGFNYRDDKMTVINSNIAEVNFWSYLFYKGDVVLFYGETDSLSVVKEGVLIDTNMRLPPNYIFRFK